MGWPRAFVWSSRAGTPPLVSGPSYDWESRYVGASYPGNNDRSGSSFPVPGPGPERPFFPLAVTVLPYLFGATIMVDV